MIKKMNAWASSWRPDDKSAAAEKDLNTFPGVRSFWHRQPWRRVLNHKTMLWAKNSKGETWYRGHDWCLSKPYLPFKLYPNKCYEKLRLMGSWNSNFLHLRCSRASVPLCLLPPRPPSGCCCTAKVRHSPGCSPDSTSPLLWGRRWSTAAGCRPKSWYGTEIFRTVLWHQKQTLLFPICCCSQTKVI